MIGTPSDSTCFRTGKRGGRRRIYLVLVGAVVAFGASTHATPALAADGIDEPPPELSIPEAIPPVPELEVDETAVVQALEELPIVVDTAVEGGDIDVSVRVLSPENEPEAPVDAAANAISNAIEPDITADPVLPDAPPPVTDPIDEDTLDTNVTIRVLSPGRDGSDEQQRRLGEDDAAEPTPDLAPAEEAEAEGAEPANPADELAETAANAPQYQANNMQYQSGGIPNPDPWVWEWYLALDCSGNVTSTSSELGSPASRDWDWKWTWDWTCGLDGASEESGDALQKGLASVASVTSPEREPDAPVRETDAATVATVEQPDASGTPWLWTWSFDFCGRETTFSIQAGEQTNLGWTWDWTWAWACTSAEVVSPDTSGEGASGMAADAGTPSGELGLPPPLAIVIEQPLLHQIPFQAGPAVGHMGPMVVEAPISIAVVEVPISIARVIPLGRTVTTGPEPAPASGPGRAPMPAPATVPIATAPSTLDIATAAPGTSRPERARPSKTRDREASPRPTRRPSQLPLGPTRRAAGSSTSSGGAAPGGGGATGVAALTGLYVLAAPGLGRRIRIVRELSPHARAEAPRDRPG